MGSSLEGKFSGRDGTKFYTKTWKPEHPSHIHLVFIHGFSDHINAYYDLFPILSSPPYNINIHGFDQRGWGRSVSGKSSWGLTGDTHQVLCDIQDFIDHVSVEIRSERTDAKLFLMGHSMGGAESLMYLLSDSKTFSNSSMPGKALPIQGLLVESPHIGFPPGNEPSPLLVFSGRIAGKLFPNMQMVQKLDSSAMCRDPKVCKDWEDDALCHDTGTLKGLAGLLDRASYLKDLGSGTAKLQAGMNDSLPCPVFWAHGTADKVCDFHASERLYRTLLANVKQDRTTGQSKLVPYNGGYHKLHAEPDGMGKQFASDAGDWILSIAQANNAPATTNPAGRSTNTSSVPIPQTTAGTESVLGTEEDNVKSRL